MTEFAKRVLFDNFIKNELSNHTSSTTITLFGQKSGYYLNLTKERYKLTKTPYAYINVCVKYSSKTVTLKCLTFQCMIACCDLDGDTLSRVADETYFEAAMALYPNFVDD